ncbi:transcriptional regulator [Alkalihalobacillus sp. BA299]|uniref:transcriptional regulator n=1 Tax=Alkalihalobacillus sp. BA299 TaxID=2815938 RepID=UPI001ADB2BD0|nr:transcriptional regulator [Alkalihalobacillus sp. BA299]
MIIKVAALVTPDMVHLTKELGKQINELSIVIDTYNDPNEAIDLFNKYVEDNDILLYGGPIPYLITHHYLMKNELEINKPMIYVPYNEISIYRGLFQMLKQMKTDTTLPLTFSVDYPAESEIRECLEELDINTDYTFTKECGHNEDLNELVSFHYNLWQSKKVQAVITSVYSVYKQLKTLGLPTYRISPAKSSIRNTLQRVVLEGKNMYQAASQIAIGIIGFKEEIDFSPRALSDYQTQRKKLKLQQILIDFGEETGALIDWSDRGELRFITTRGQIVSNTKNFQQIPVLLEIQKELKLSPYLGIGFGSTAHEAETKAYEGFTKAKSVGDGSCFIVELDGNVHGPVGEAVQLKYSVRSEDPNLIALAKNASLSIGTINKLLAFSNYSSDKKFTALELASSFGITLRSARRILSKLEENDYVKIIGEEQPISRGRPRQIYQLNLQLPPLIPNLT